MSEQPFTPFPFQQGNGTPAAAETKLSFAPPAKEKKKRGGRKPAASKVAKPVRKAARKPRAEPTTGAPDLAVNFVLSVLIGLSQAEQQTVAMLMGMQAASRERILKAAEKLLATK